MKKRLLFLLLMVAIALQVMAEMSLVVRPMYGTDKITALQEIGKLVYSGDSLLVYDNVGTRVYADLFENVKYVRYSDEEPSITVGDVDVKNQIVVYPNPTVDVLYIDNVGGSVVRLYSVDGRLMQTQEVGEGRVAVDMSGCSAGVYVLVCGREVFNVIKN